MPHRHFWSWNNNEKDSTKQEEKQNPTKESEKSYIDQLSNYFESYNLQGEQTKSVEKTNVERQAGVSALEASLRSNAEDEESKEVKNKSQI